MKFEYIVKNGCSKFVAITENENEYRGFRSQGPYTPIKLSNNVLNINYVSKNPLHPDILAAICVIAFYPFIKYSATMPLPVSKNFADSLKRHLPQREIIDGKYQKTSEINITNVDNNLKPYSFYDYNTSVIAYGGGMDSTSVALLFPESPLIYNNRGDTKEIKKFIRNLPNKNYIINSNIEQLVTPKGFTTWTCVFLIPYILSADLSIKYILSGTILGSTSLANGKKFLPMYDIKLETSTGWRTFLREIGPGIVDPVGGVSELITSKIIYEHKMSEQVLFCESNKGRPCHKCTKCLRKLLELSYHGYNFNFEIFDQTKISNWLKIRPLYFSHIFIETIKNSKNKLPMYLKDSISDIINTKTDIFNKIYSKSFEHIPVEIRDIVIEKLRPYAEIMDEEDEKYLRSWDMTINR